MPADLRPLTAQVHDSCRGNQVTLCPDRDGAVRIFEWRSECVRAEVIGVTIGIERDASHCCPTPGRFALPAVRAHVEWGIGSASFRARADVLNGTVLSVAAECLKVCVEYIIWGDDCASDLPSFKVAAGSSYGASSGIPAQLTELVCAEAGDTGQVEIPPFAMSFVVLPIEPSTTPLTGSVLGPEGAPRVNFVVPMELGHHGPKSTPLFNGATCVEISNVEGASQRAFFVIFELAL